MLKFNVAHVAPESSAHAWHGLLGYCEIVESVHWGLKDLGYDATVSRNSLSSDRTNIVIGAQMLTDAQLRILPYDTIVYNFEQIAGVDTRNLKPEIATVAERFDIWDYSQANVEAWAAMSPKRSVSYVPVGWAPILARINNSVPQDLDVLFYGLPGSQRLQVFRDLCFHGLRCAYLCGMYGEARDRIIDRSKLILNINQDDSRIFEIVRVSYLLANSKAVVADIQPNVSVEPGVETAILFCESSQIVAKCVSLLKDDTARHALEERGHSYFRSRPISPILRAALAK
jgi:hypothetical protein